MEEKRFFYRCESVSSVATIFPRPQNEAAMAKRTPPQNGNGKHAATKSRIESVEPIDAIGDGVSDEAPSRLPVLKTYKLFVGGKFPRSESGRYEVVRDLQGEPLANVCRGSKKDFRDAVVAARAAQSGWAKKTAYNRAQILYRIAEMLEGRKAQFIDELTSVAATAGGATSVALTSATAKAELQQSIDRLVYYAGWADKYQQVFSSVNPVASSHFNFSLNEPTGLVVAIAPDAPALLGLITLIAPAIVGGNAVIVLAGESNPLPAITFGEVLATSDLPGGVVNLLTGKRAELIEHFASHMDVNALIYAGNDREHLKTLQTLAANNVKRVVTPKLGDYTGSASENPYLILDTQEVKTTWHPVGT